VIWRLSFSNRQIADLAESGRKGLPLAPRPVCHGHMRIVIFLAINGLVLWFCNKNKIVKIDYLSKNRKSQLVF